MPKEIERKFLVITNAWCNKTENKTPMRQGYVRAIDCTVRVRIAETTGYLTIKGRTENFTRDEYEYEIPLQDAEEMLNNLCHGGSVEKFRYKVIVDGNEWVIDEFTGLNRGLIMAEIELNSETQSFSTPEWLGEEVSHDSRYTNGALAMKPYSTWE
ncbi:MAG: CYTH domain-containing protein [Victivallaceae bacterium]|nr:CYTH domain-containing protein [Victivallaceae bacterium]